MLQCLIFTWLVIKIEIPLCDERLLFRKLRKKNPRRVVTKIFYLKYLEIFIKSITPAYSTSNLLKYF